MQGCVVSNYMHTPFAVVSHSDSMAVRAYVCVYNMNMHTCMCIDVCMYMYVYMCMFSNAAGR